MKLKTILGISTVLTVVATVGLVVYGQRKPACVTADNEVYDGRIQQVKGRVMYLNHPQLGKTPANGQYLVFQRQDCKDCLVATHADMNGDYKIFVGVGRYKLIVQETRCDYGGNCAECSNLLASDQAQHVEVERNRPYSAAFDINLVLPKQ